MNEFPKPICLHFHIFKNAGTTIDSILEKNFSKDAVRIDTEKPSEIIPMDIILDYLKKNPEIKSISSHQIRFPIPTNSVFNFIPMLFIRHPLDRIFSIYSYQKNRKDPRNEAARKARITTPKEFIEWSLGAKKNMVMKNFQVMFLSKNDVSVEVEDFDFKLAVNRMKLSIILGVVDRLNESLVMAEEVLSHYFPNIDLSYVPKKISKERADNLIERLEEGKTLIGNSLMNELNSKNEFDLKLYSLANDELDNRIKKIENFDNKVENLKRRCSNKTDTSLPNLAMLKNRRIWYSSEDKLFYHKNPEKGTKKILCYADKKEN